MKQELIGQENPRSNSEKQIGSHNELLTIRKDKSDMRSSKNLILHGVYFFLYSPVKYLSFPFSNIFRYIVVRIFSSSIHTSFISEGVTIYFPWNVQIGKESSLNSGVIIDGYGHVNIGEGVRIAAYTCINTADHAFDRLDTRIMDQGYITGEVIIEDNVWIGAGTKINKGVRIGEGSVIGSGSVVTKSIPSFSVAAGVPCKIIKSRK
jgi:acetyltransferase-like isoleucine patch superfamily enzyme